MYHVELAGEEGSTAVLCLALVCDVILEEFTLIVKCGLDRLVGVDITLTTVDHWHITQTQGDNSASEDIHNIRSGVPITRMRRRPT